MLFNSYVFIFVFLPCTLALYFILARYRGANAAKALLVLASLVYYGWWNVYYLPLILGSAVANFVIAYFILRYRTDAFKRRMLLYLGVCFNLGLLGYYKYANFFVDNINWSMGSDFNLGVIILPIGISFFTFQQIAYLVDASRGISEEHHFLDYLLFVSFFPQLIAGPIVHHAEMMPQFRKRETFRFSWENLSVGFTLFSIGLAKKVLVADQIGVKASDVFGAAAMGVNMPPEQVWLGAFAYAFQLYFDFSGYTDMALGLGRMFGITLPTNFNSPYKSADVVEFWRRWHMTLSRFLRDYVYIPLGGSHRGKWRTQFNLMTTMLLGGLWHGAGWTFIIWGGLHGVYLWLSHLWRWGVRDRLPSKGLLHGCVHSVSIVVTFVAVTLAFVFFRADDVHTAWQMVSDMFGANPVWPEMENPIVKQRNWLFIGLLALAVWLLPNSMQIMRKYKPTLWVYRDDEVESNPSLPITWKPTVVYGILISILFAFAVLSLSNRSEFLYYQF